MPLRLRAFQKQAIDSLSSAASAGESRHLACVAPTGSGKSLIYETLARRPGTRLLLITPLVALARQQALRLAQAGVPRFLHAGGARERPSGTAGASSGTWILSPEALQLEVNRERVRRWKPNLLVVDECHCLWDWGERFRPTFCEIPGLVRSIGIPRSLWLSATLPADAFEELKAGLGELELQGEFGLPPGLLLSAQQVEWSRRLEALLGWLGRRTSECGLLHVPTRADTNRFARLIRGTLGLEATAYHGGLSAEERSGIEDRLRRDEIRWVIATSAFGLGMDIPSLQWTALIQAPSSLLELAQAVGRVARAGKRGSARVFWSDEDFAQMEWKIQGSARRRRELARARAYFREVRCRELGLKDYFALSHQREGTGSAQACGRCDICQARRDAVGP